MDLTQYSAYGGGSWEVRHPEIGKEDKYYNSSGGECCVWNDDFGINSEYMPLRSVFINMPNKTAIREANKDPEKFQLLDIVDYGVLHQEILEYAHFLSTDLSINVRLGDYRNCISKPNFVFARDLFAMTPKGAILGRPATAIRAGEEVAMMRSFCNNRLPILATIVKGTFEGADMLWLDDKFIVVDHSSRTTIEAASRIHDLTDQFGAVCMHTHIDTPGNQHLLGVCNIVNNKVACIRKEKIPNDLVDFMSDLGYKFIEFDETTEVVYKQAMNLVTVYPGQVCMPDDCPETEEKLLSSGHVIKVYKFKISELRKMAGGLACLTGILSRDLL